MAVKLNSLRADMRRQNDGDWVEIPDLPGVAFKIRGLHYGPFQIENSIIRGRWVRKYGSAETVPVDISSRDIAHLYGKHLLLDWRGFDEDYTPELAEEMLASPGEFFGHVLWAVTQVSRTEAEFVEESAKNSERSSAGNAAAGQ